MPTVWSRDWTKDSKRMPCCCQSRPTPSTCEHFFVSVLPSSRLPRQRFPCQSVQVCPARLLIHLRAVQCFRDEVGQLWGLLAESSVSFIPPHLRSPMAYVGRGLRKTVWQRQRTTHAHTAKATLQEWMPCTARRPSLRRSKLLWMLESECALRLSNGIRVETAVQGSRLVGLWIWKSRSMCMSAMTRHDKRPCFSCFPTSGVSCLPMATEHCDLLFQGRLVLSQ